MKPAFENSTPDFKLLLLKPEDGIGLYQKQFTSSRACYNKRKMFREWKQDGLIPTIGGQWSAFANPEFQEQNKHEEWSWLNFYELVWVRLVNELRNFNYPKPEIKQFLHESSQTLPASVLESLPLYQSILATADTKERYFELCSQLNRQPLDAELNQILTHISSAIAATTLFEYHIQMSIFGRTPLVFYVTKNYGIIPHTPLVPLEPENEITLKKALADSYITISLLSLIDDFLLGEENQGHSFFTDFLSPQEEEIIGLLRSKRLKKVVLSYDEKTEAIFKAEVFTSEVLNSKSDGKAILAAIRSADFKKVNLTYINDNNVYVEKEEVIKL